MSLLLDALHRASKDKEKTASAAVVPPTPAAEPRAAETPPAETWQLTNDFPDLTAPEPASTDPRPGAEAAQAASPVALTLELEPVPQRVFEPELALAQQPAPTPAPELAPVPQPEATPVPAPEPVAKPAVQVEMAKLLAGKYAAPPASASAPIPEIAPVVKPVVVSPPVEAPAVKKPEPAPPERAAQDIRRAYASTKPGKSGANRRLIILGGVAGVLALAIGSVFSGLWGDPEKILGLSGQSSVATTALPQPSAPAAPQPDVVASQAAHVPDTAAAALPAEPLPAYTRGAGPTQVVSAEKNLTTVKSPQSAAIPPPVPLAAPVAAQSVPRAPSGEVTLRSKATRAPLPARANGVQELELGYAALLEGRLDDAAQAYASALAVNPEERDALSGMAYIYHKKGQREQAQEAYRQVLRQDPTNATAQSGLLALDSLSDTTLTAGRARALADRQPGSAAAMASAGSALVRDGLLADAALAFAKAQAIEPGNPLHAYNHAVALDRLGQFAAALNQYETVLNLWGGSAVPVRAFQIETVRQRVAQLRQAFGNPGEKTR